MPSRGLVTFPVCVRSGDVFLTKSVFDGLPPSGVDEGWLRAEELDSSDSSSSSLSSIAMPIPIETRLIEERGSPVT